MDLAIERSESLPAQPERIVSLAPNVTEILFALGVGGRVVAVTEYCDHPAEATDRPSIGSFANPEFERILAREPDLVLGVVSGGPRSIFEQLERTDVPFAFLRISTIEQTYAGIRRIGAYVHAGDRAETLVASMRREMQRISRRWRGRSSSPRVLMVYGHEPLVGAGPETFGHQLLVRAGARNVLAGAETKYPRLDAEKVLELEPRRIVDTSMDEKGEGGAFWQSYDMLGAVRRGDVVSVADAVVLRPGPRLPAALERVARAAHGDAAAADAGGAR